MHCCDERRRFLLVSGSKQTAGAPQHEIKHEDDDDDDDINKYKQTEKMGHSLNDAGRMAAIWKVFFSSDALIQPTRTNELRRRRKKLLISHFSVGRNQSTWRVKCNRFMSFRGVEEEEDSTCSSPITRLSDAQIKSHKDVCLSSSSLTVWQQEMKAKKSREST